MWPFKKKPTAAEATTPASDNSGYKDIVWGWISPDEEREPQDDIFSGVINYDWARYDDVWRDDAVKAGFTQNTTALGMTETTIEPASQKRADRKAGDFIKEQLDNVEFDNVLELMFLGFFYGRSFSEIMLARDGLYYALEGLAVRDQRRFFPDGEWRLRLETTDTASGVLMPEWKFWQFYEHSHNADDGGVGLAQWLYYLTFFKHNLRKFQQQHLEKFGSPPLILFYPESWDNREDGAIKEKTKLLTIGKGMRRDSVALLPRPADPAFSPDQFMRLVEPVKDGSGLFQLAISDLDRAIFRLIIGQTATIEQASGMLGNTAEQNTVLENIVKSRADRLMASFNRQVVRTLIELNKPAFSGITGYPKVWRVFPMQENLDARAERDSKIVAFTGKPLTVDYVKAVYGDEYEFAEPPMPTATPSPMPETEPETEAEPEEEGETYTFASADPSDLEQVTAAMARDVSEVVETDMLAFFEKEIAKYETIESAQEALPEIFKRMNKDNIANVLGDWLAVADLAGYQK